MKLQIDDLLQVVDFFVARSNAAAFQASERHNQIMSKRANKPILFIPWLLGYSVVFVVDSVFSTLPYPVFASASFGETILLMSNGLSLLLILVASLFSRHVQTWLASTSVMLAVSLSGAVGLALLCISGLDSFASTIVLLFALLCFSVFYCFAFLAWMLVYSRLKPLSLVMHLAASYVLFTLISTLSLIEPFAFPLMVVSVALPLVGFICLRKSLAETTDVSCAKEPGFVHGMGVLTVESFPTLLIGAFFIITFSSSWLNGLDGVKGQGINLLGGTLFAMVMVVVVRTSTDLSCARGFLMASSTLIAIGALLLFVPGLPPVFAAQPLIYAGHTAFAIMATSVLLLFCQRKHVSPVWLLGMVQAGTYLAFFVGSSLGSALFAQRGEPAPITVMLAVVFTIVSIMLVAIDKSYPTLWGVLTPRAEFPVPSSDQVVVSRCAVMARRYDLTLREEEVLCKLVQRKTAGEIATELFISESTVKTHVKHIYAKMGVKKKAQLIGLVSSEGEEASL